MDQLSCGEHSALKRKLPLAQVDGKEPFYAAEDHPPATKVACRRTEGQGPTA